MMSRLREIYLRFFPEREIYVRSQGAMRYVTLSPRVQFIGAVLAFGLVGFVASLAFRTLEAEEQIVASSSVVADATRERDERIRVLTDRNERLRAELADSERRLTDILSQTDDIVGERASLTGVEQVLQGRLDAARRRLEDVIRDRNEKLRELEDLRRRVLDLEQQLSTAQQTAEDRRQNLDDFVGALETTTQERDEARETILSLSSEVEELSQDIEDIRSHQALVLGQIEEATEASLLRLEGILESADIDVEALIQDIERAYSGEGGPFVPIVYRIPEAARGFPLDEEAAARILDRLQRANAIRIALDRLPIAHPVRDTHRRSSGFGPRRHPTTGRWAMHAGLDLAAEIGTPVYAPSAGRVIFAGRRGSYGNLIRIRHPFGYETRYAHLSEVLVSPGDEVTTGQLIGRIGNTGRSTGPHLHYEIRYYDKPVNPWPYIKAGQDVL